MNAFVVLHVSPGRHAWESRIESQVLRALPRIFAPSDLRARGASGPSSRRVGEAV